MNSAIVTGASSGMGREFVRQLSGYVSVDEIWAVARRASALETLKAEASVPVRPIVLDLLEASSFTELEALLESEKPNVRLLVNAAGFGTATQTVLPQEIVTAVEDCGFFESIPLWAVTLIGGLFITILSFIMIMSVYGRFFRLYLYTAIAPVPLSTFAGEPSQNVGKSFIKSYAAVCLEGAIIVLACIIFSLFAASPPAVDPNAAAVSMVWSYIGELIFNMLVLVGAVKMADRVVREMMGL